MPGNQTNVEYWFRILYDCIHGACYGSSGFTELAAWFSHLWLWIVVIGYVISALAFFVIVYALIRLFDLRKREEVFYNTLIEAPEKTGGTSARWAHIETLIEGSNPSDWRAAIIEADIMLDELLSKKVLFELHALGTAEKKFFCEFLLSYIYFMKKFNQEGYSDDFKNAILVDEAHHIFLKDKPNFIKESITEMIYRELREYGISLICLDQHISKLSEAVAGNSATLIAFQQVLPQDVDTISGLMQIKERKKYG